VTLALEPVVATPTVRCKTIDQSALVLRVSQVIHLRAATRELLLGAVKLLLENQSHATELSLAKNTVNRCQKLLFRVEPLLVAVIHPPMKNLPLELLLDKGTVTLLAILTALHSNHKEGQTMPQAVEVENVVVSLL